MTPQPIPRSGCSATVVLLSPASGALYIFSVRACRAYLSGLLDSNYTVPNLYRVSRLSMNANVEA